MEKDTIFTTVGYKIVEGAQIKLGTGSMPDGSFKFIRISSNSLFGYTSTTPNAANNANAMSRSASGHSYKVAKVVDRGSKKHGYTYYALINVGITRYEIDLENAIATGELAVPPEFKKQTATSTTPAASTSTADEIIKLKKLLDDGVITKEEFDKQKTKLLNQ
jgi:hypothetical protein